MFHWLVQGNKNTDLRVDSYSKLLTYNTLLSNYNDVLKSVFRFNISSKLSYSEINLSGRLIQKTQCSGTEIYWVYLQDLNHQTIPIKITKKYITGDRYMSAQTEMIDNINL